MGGLVIAYTDYKSPYAYLAKDPTWALADLPGVRVEWRPYVLDVASFLGSAEVDDAGRVVRSSRSEHQWRRARYTFMDARRQAVKRGLELRATRRIFDSRLAGAGMLFAQAAGEGVLRRYHDLVFERFWRRALDIESVTALEGLLEEAGIRGFAAHAGALVERVEAISREAEALGIFGVPSFVVDGALFWGREHLEDIRGMLG
jgi:2-hydroxychromene-2-carboxylate isomerase